MILNMTRNMCLAIKAFALSGRGIVNTRSPGCRYALPWAMCLLPFQGAYIYISSSDLSIMLSLHIRFIVISFAHTGQGAYISAVQTFQSYFLHIRFIVISFTHIILCRIRFIGGTYDDDSCPPHYIRSNDFHYIPCDVT